MRRFLHVFWRRRRDHPEVGCPHCGQLLLSCPSCGGHWREQACGRCGIGALCPTHENHWPA